MRRSARAKDLFTALRERLRLTLIAGESGANVEILDAKSAPSNRVIAGPLNYIHPHPIQVIGHTEMAYLDSLGEQRQKALGKVISRDTAAIILVDGVDAEQALIDLANAQGVCLLSSPLPDNQVLDNLQYFASLFLSEKTTLHGVFLEVLGMGVLITGDPAVGKSELALELISRGNRLVADDAPEFSQIAPDIISGSCPPLLSEFLEVRGLGVLNIRAMFGDSAIKRTKYLRLIVHLMRMTDEEIAQMDRLSGSQTSREVLGVAIPQVSVPVAPGRNLAILVEAAVRNHLLKLKGYDATEALIQRQQKAIQDND